MIEHEVHVNLDALRVGGVHEGFEIGLGAIQRVHRRVVVHVVAVVGIGGMGRAQPQSRGAQAIQVVQLVLDALEVADTVAVAVGEGIDQQLVGGGSALIAVKRGRSGHNSHLGGAGLGYAHAGFLAAAGHVHAARTGTFARVGIHRHRQGAVPAARNRRNMDPSGRCRCRPGSGCRYGNELGCSFLFGERQRRGAYGKAILRCGGHRFFLSPAGHQHYSGPKYPNNSFHMRK